MAQIAAKYIETDWKIDEAFRYLTRDIGLQGDFALYQMQESILAGRLPVKVTHALDGAVQGKAKAG